MANKGIEIGDPKGQGGCPPYVYPLHIFYTENFFLALHLRYNGVVWGKELHT